MGDKTRGNYPVTVCVTNEPCVNKGEKCDRCISKSQYLAIKKETKEVINGCETTVWSRVTGFWRPVQNYNPGKVEEFKDRKKYNIKEYINGNTTKKRESK